MHGKPELSWRNHSIFMLMAAMLIALFFSRALLSAIIIGFTVVSFFQSSPRRQFSIFFSTPLLWGMSLLFFLPLLSGLWSDDSHEWQLMMMIKAPLFLLPLGFAASFELSKSQWSLLLWLFIALVAGGSCWSVFHYADNAAVINESYLRAKTLQTPLENDHVRFSWLLSIAIFFSLRECWLNIKGKKIIFWLMLAIAVWLISFLHLLAARTGLLSFYAMIICTAGWVAFKQWQFGLILVIAVLGLPFIAYKTIPTFHNRVNYFLYDADIFKKGEYLPGANDGVRMISLRAGFAVMQQSPVTGAGFGDVIHKSKEWYAKHYPQMIAGDQIYPSSAFLMYGAGLGWPGLLIMIAIILLPFFIRIKGSPEWLLLNLSVLLSLLFDPALEVQYGVFAYSFIVLWNWKWLTAKKM